MKLYHITKQGALHFQLKNGRLAAVYPDTGYVRVSHAVRERYRMNAVKHFNNAVENKNPGNITMWPINKRVKAKTMQPVNMELFYKASWSGEIYKYPKQVFFEMASSNCELYPNDIVKLMDLLTEFEAKNC